MPKYCINSCVFYCNRLIICDLGQLSLVGSLNLNTPRVFPGFGEKLGSDNQNYYVWKQSRDLWAAI